ncbi:rubrerythrin family protein [Haloplanus ruber]|uniref:Rubrerythrin family protein n=1 Tax=Haloplanus ruber TaxID=869892 RepID=A0ABD6CUP5_9EURY|nr:hypothetical protein [Haloplanus ruber]
MDGSTLVETVRTDRETELGRLGSEKALVASTAARLDRASVLDATLDAERRAAATFAAWAADEGNDTARVAFDRVASQEREHAERVRDLLDAAGPDEDPGSDALHAHLRDLDATVERIAAGFVARPLVSERSLLQVVNFFVNEADEQAADTVRGLRSETQALTDDGATLLDACCGDDDWDQAREAADRTVDVAYAQYEERLTEMGVDPKPVC